MVSRTKGPSFFGLPPAALKPRERTFDTAQPSDSEDSEYYPSDSDDSMEVPPSDMDDSMQSPPSDWDYPLRPDFENSIVQEDENLWAEWQDQQLPQAFSRLLRPQNDSFQVCPSTCEGNFTC
jgi:hypothetical protein